MGYLDPSVLTIDAILTRKGREALAKNDGSFRITQFALADDEIDYTLYNPSHPSGSAFYGDGSGLYNINISNLRNFTSKKKKILRIHIFDKTKDPYFNIKWPHEPALISDKDLNWPLLT